MNDRPADGMASTSATDLRVDAGGDARVAMLGTLVSVAESVAEHFERALEPLGMSMAKLKVLRHLAAANEPLPLGQLADRSACVRSNVTQLVDRMESCGLVQRMADPDDRRCTRAVLTELGRSYLARGNAAVAAAEQALLAKISEEQVSQIVTALRTLQTEG